MAQGRMIVAIAGKVVEASKIKAGRFYPLRGLQMFGGFPSLTLPLSLIILPSLRRKTGISTLSLLHRMMRCRKK